MLWTLAHLYTWQYGSAKVLIIARKMLITIIKKVVSTARINRNDSLTFQLRNSVTAWSL